jgi:hypothetical protein
MVDQNDEVLAIAKLISALLESKQPAVQGAVLAQLLAVYLAGHWIPGDPHQTLALRESILLTHCQFVRRLTQANSQLIGTNE